MKLHLYFTSRRDLESPLCIGGSHLFEEGSRFSLGRIPFGKRWFDCNPCKPCNALIADRRKHLYRRGLYKT